MTQTKIKLDDVWTGSHVSAVLKAASVVLVVDATNALATLSPQPGRQSVVVTRKSMLSSQMIKTIQPDAVVGPLISEDWDIVDLGLELEALGYRGDLFVVTKPLPRAELVIREVGAVCRGLTVHLLEKG
ncbi:MAG: hypothetical protein Kow0013_18890 [Pararhodobacter sp.]